MGNKLLLSLVSFFTFFFLSLTSVQAATHTVSSGESIQNKCVNIASSGDICEVTSGSYSGFTVSKSITINCTGTCTVPNISVSGSGVTISGFEVANGTGITLAGQNHLIKDNYVHDLTTPTDGGISLYSQSSSSKITITNNKIIRAYNACIFVSGTNHIIDGNECSYTKQGGDADCFRAFGSGHHFKNNYCHDIWYGVNVTSAHMDCIQSWNWISQGGTLRDSIFEYNRCDLPDQNDSTSGKGFQMEGTTGDGITPDPNYPYPCRNNIFRYNLMHHNLLALFWYCENMTVTNNTFIGDADVDSDGIHIYYSRGTNKVQYNVFVDQDEKVFYGNTTESSNSIVGGYNCIYRSVGTPFGSPQTGDVWDKDPLFVDASKGDYRLQSNSPCCTMGAYPCLSSQTINTPTPSQPAASIPTRTPTQTPSRTPTPIATRTPAPTATPIPKPGDANGDNVVNEADYATWLANFEKNVTGAAHSGDFNGNGVVDGVDYVVWYRYYGT